MKGKITEIQTRILAVGTALLLTASLLTGCSASRVDDKNQGNQAEKSDRLQVTATIFPYYDFARQVAGEYADVSMVIPAGMDTHSFEPTAADMIAIGKTDVFLYNGGETENWVDQVLEAADNKSLLADAMMSHVDIYEEEVVEGMEDHGEEEEGHAHEETEYDEHIWTSPVNAQKLVQQIADDLSQADPAHQEMYQKNADAYIEELKHVDQEIRNIVSGAKNPYLVFGDRFPLRYFVEEYDLEYSAAFAGCSSDTEPSAETIAWLTKQVREKEIPVILKIELTSDRVANTIAEVVDAEVATFYTCHNVMADQMEEGVTYVSLMKENEATLRRALK